jgi:NADPH:quinone reductase-like Zn-dependent oxidoreductase
LQQFALVPSGPNTTAKLPDNITEDEAATIPTALNTAAVALYDDTGFGFPSPFEKGGETFGNGKSILVLGGSSVIGLVGIPSLVFFIWLMWSTSIGPSFGILSNHYYSSKET